MATVGVKGKRHDVAQVRAELKAAQGSKDSLASEVAELQEQVWMVTEVIPAELQGGAMAGWGVMVWLCLRGESHPCRCFSVLLSDSKGSPQEARE